MLGIWVKIMVDQRRSRRNLKQVKHSVLSVELSHDLHACVNVLMHVDIFRGMYTSLGTGDLLVCMLGSWEKIMVDQRRSRRSWTEKSKFSTKNVRCGHRLTFWTDKVKYWTENMSFGLENQL